jgi:hypothetical protein
MRTRAETPELHLLPILDLLRIAIAPFHWYIAIRIGIDQYVERAVAIELGEEGYRGGDLAEDRLDLGLDLGFGLLGGGLWCPFSICCRGVVRDGGL